MSAIAYPICKCKPASALPTVSGRSRQSLLSANLGRSAYPMVSLKPAVRSNRAVLHNCCESDRENPADDGEH
jgi:hypothetical protein